MTDHPATSEHPSARNIGELLVRSTALAPDRPAVVSPLGRGRDGRYRYRTRTFRELEEETRLLAQGLLAQRVPRGARLALFVPFSWEFLTLTYALMRGGMVVVLVDPGMGKANILQCLRRIRPEGFVAISLVHALRVLKRRMFPDARHHVTVGRRWFWGGATYRSLLQSAGAVESQPVDGINEFIAVDQAAPHDVAAVIFTSGSTGPPKGVVYEHGMFVKQVELIQRFYGIAPGEVDLPGFPLFGLFNAAMGVTTVIPDMDPTRPAHVDPRRILAQMDDHQVTQAFGSPAFWNRIGRFCEQHQRPLSTLRRALSAGGPVPLHVIERMSRALTHTDAELHTPYGATESLPVTSIGSREVLQETAALTRIGRGTCVGRPFPEVEVAIIPITAGPLDTITSAHFLPPGEIGEIIVSGPSITREYFQDVEANRLSKIHGERDWHRIGDVGYLDEQGRLWFCGRKAHVVQTPQGRLFSVCCEAIFNEHPAVYRSALIPIGTGTVCEPGIVVEPEPGCFPEALEERQRLTNELLDLGARHAHTAAIRKVYFHRSFPVDTRHNVKINREALRDWARRQDGSA